MYTVLKNCSSGETCTIREWEAGIAFSG